MGGKNLLLVLAAMFVETRAKIEALEQVVGDFVNERFRDDPDELMEFNRLWQKRFLEHRYHQLSQFENFDPGLAALLDSILDKFGRTHEAD